MISGDAVAAMSHAWRREAATHRHPRRLTLAHQAHCGMAGEANVAIFQSGVNRRIESQSQPKRSRAPVWVRQPGIQLDLFKPIVHREGGVRIAAAIRRSDRERQSCRAELGTRGESRQYDGYAEHATRLVVEAERLSPRFDAQRERCLDGMKQRARLVISGFRNQTGERPADQGCGDPYATLR